MANVIWSIGVSLDGYIADASGDFDWAAPDAELHRFHNEQTGELGAHLTGRRLYETMLPWETTDPSAEGATAEFYGIWQALPKIVFSRSRATPGWRPAASRKSSRGSARRTWRSAAPGWPPSSRGAT